MNLVIKEKWIAALRSGNYQQGANALHSVEDTERFCCLGVLCDLAFQEGAASRELDPIQDQYYYSTPTGNVNRLVLPTGVMKWAGLKDEDPTVPLPGLDDDEATAGLAWLNDNGYTFKQIAAIIEEHVS